MATYPVTESTIYSKRSGEAVRHKVAKQVPAPSELLDERVFVHMLRLERKKSERSHEPFVLMLFEGASFSQTGSSPLMGEVSRAIWASTRETDVLGWYEQNRVLGLIVSQVGESALSNAGMVAERIGRALQKRLAPETFAALKMRVRIFPDESDDERDDGGDFTFYRDLTASHDHRRAPRSVKRMMDIALSSIALIALSPVLFLIALLVKLTSEGPILFRQQRVGRYGVPFTFLKFRSMYVNNDPRIHQEYVARLISGDAEVNQNGDGGQATYKIVNDPRITRLGKFLRKSSLDELPQLFNVLKGEMSLVGPRPPVPYEFEKYHTWHKRRVFEVQPGITGLWQVMGRSKTTFEEMVRLDLRYVKNWSLKLDFKILLQTPKAVLSADGAY